MKSTQIVSRELFVPHVYASLDESDKKFLSEAEYADYVSWLNACSDAAIERIVYTSDGLKIVGILAYPTAITDGKLLPVIIYNRGGSGEAGKITVQTIKDRIYPFVHAGYVVIASQYRGNDGSEGVDQLGGDDVDDVINLYDVIKELPFADSKQLFMVGFSRGAINTYRALQQHRLPIKACAVACGVSDLFLFEQVRPDAIPLLERFIPEYHTNKAEQFAQRSANYWAQDITVPILLLHGDADTVMDVAASKNLAERFSQYGVEHKLVIYPGENHFFSNHMRAVINEILAWFTSHMR